MSLKEEAYEALTGVPLVLVRELLAAEACEIDYSEQQEEASA